MDTDRRVFRPVVDSGGLAVVAAAVPVRSAQTEYPAKPVRIVVPFPPGGSVDLNARLLASSSPRSSASRSSSTIAPARRADRLGTRSRAAAPDGYTLLLQSNPFVTSTILYSKSLYDPINDFAPISLLSTVATAVAVHPSVRFTRCAS
jgi:tripartite-type tricarboxylate transporter receptor subunit TctC